MCWNIRNSFSISSKTEGFHQLGEIRQGANQQGSIPWDVDRHYQRECLSNGLLDFQVPRCGGHHAQVLITPCRDVAADFGPQGLPGMVRSKGQCVYAAFSVAAEVTLVTGQGQLRLQYPYHRSVCSVSVGDDRRAGHLEPFSRCPCYLFCSDACQTS